MKHAPRNRQTRAPREPQNAPEGVNPFRARHLDIAARVIAGDDGPIGVLINEAETPLGWPARRKGRDGRVMISPHQLLAGERLRADFTRGNLSPRVTSDWSAPT